MTYNTPASAGQTVYGMNKCNGAILKSTPDGVVTQVYAWGLHNIKNLSVDDNGHLWVLDGGMEDRGVRPIIGGKDSLHQLSQDTWYGWPDFNVGEPVLTTAIYAERTALPPKPYT